VCWIARLLRLYRPMLRRFFRAEVRGLERLDHRPCLLVANHSIGAPFEVLALLDAWVRRFGPERPAYGLTHTLSFRLPLFRGAVVLIESLWNGLAALNFSAEHAAPEEAGKSGEKPSQLAIGGTMALSLAFGLALFVGVPHLLTWGIGRLAGHPLDTTAVAFHLVDGALRLLVFLGYLAAISRLPDIRRVFQYHGAEHKSIWAYEKETALTVDDAQAQSTLHPRCGTSFLLLVVGVSIALFAAVFPFVPRLAEGELANTLLQLLVKIPLMLPIAGLSYELQRASARFPENPILKTLTAPGLWLQRITTREPTRDQLEIAVIAMRRCIAYEEGQLRGDGVRLFRDFDGAIAVP
jgi:uncharacterized protein YqhQ